MEIWSAYLLPSVYAFAACVAFTFVFNIHGWGKLICGVGGAIGWLMYLLCGEDILAAFIAAVSILLYELFAAELVRVFLDDSRTERVAALQFTCWSWSRAAAGRARRIRGGRRSS